MLIDKKLTAYSKIIAGLPDVPSPAMSALQLKQHFDTAPEEMRVAFNALIDNLLSTTTGDSGAESIGIEPIVGVSAANVQNALEQLKLSINDAVAGTIPDGSLAPSKLSFDPATQAELDAHASDFTTHVEYALATGTANTYVVTLTPTPTSYTRGMAVSVEINVLNTGASTININGLGAKAIKKSNGNDVLAGNLKVGIIYTLRYNGTNFILQGEGGEYGTAVAGDVVAPKTIGTDAGLVTGTIVDRGTLNVTPTGVVQNFPAGKYTSVAVQPSKGVQAGTVVIVNAGTLRWSVSSTYVKIKEMTLKGGGAYRISFQLSTQTAGTPAYGQIFKNGSPIGIERNTTSDTSVSFTEDIAGWNDADKVQVYIRGTSGLNSYVQTFQVSILPPTIDLD